MLTEVQKLLDKDAAQGFYSVEERLAMIDTLSEALFSANKQFVPLYPWVFVLVCAKEQRIGSLILPEKQNKTVHEGIVLATWNNKLVERGIVHKDGQRLTRCEMLRSEFIPGDRVLFHHYAGAPVPGYDVDRFRVVRECDWQESKQGGIFMKMTVDEDQTKPLKQLQELLGPFIQDALTEEELSMLAAKIEDRFLVLDRLAPSVTLSGR